MTEITMHRTRISGQTWSAFKPGPAPTVSAPIEVEETTFVPVGEVAVKALAWKDPRGDGTLWASTGLGLVYVASEKGWGFRNYPDQTLVEGGIEEAKAAAQADFNQRIRAALVTP